MELILHANCGAQMSAKLRSVTLDAATVELACAIAGMPGTLSGDIEHYAGEYDVTPLVTAQVLATRDKLMDDNVRVNMIPTREESNAAGGVTFIVG